MLKLWPLFGVSLLGGKVRIFIGILIFVFTNPVPRTPLTQMHTLEGYAYFDHHYSFLCSSKNMRSTLNTSECVVMKSAMLAHCQVFVFGIEGTYPAYWKGFAATTVRFDTIDCSDDELAWCELKGVSAFSISSAEKKKNDLWNMAKPNQAAKRELTTHEKAKIAALGFVHHKLIPDDPFCNPASRRKSLKNKIDNDQP